MGILHRLFKKKEISTTQENPYIERAKKARATRLQNELKRFSLDRKIRKLERLKQKQEELEIDEQIANLEEDLYEDDPDTPQAENSPDRLLNSILEQAMQRMQQKDNPNTQGVQPTQVLGEEIASSQGTVRYSNEQIELLIDQLTDEQLFQLRNLPDPQLKQAILQKSPDIDQDTVERAVMLIKEA